MTLLQLRQLKRLCIIIIRDQMKKATSIGSTEPTVRILLVGPHLYQVCFRNIYGYLKAILIDRCKKVGATYRHFEKSYFLDSDKLVLLKKEFEDVLQLKNSDSQMKFRIEDFPMTNIKIMLKQDTKSEQKVNSKHRIVFIDKLSENRYFYVRKRFEQYLPSLSKEHISRENKNWLIITSDINKRIWTSLILQVKKPSNPPNSVKIESQTTSLPTVVDLTYSELTSKKSGQSIKKPVTSLNQQRDEPKIYLLTYDNIKFVEGSWFLSEIKSVESVITDDGQFLISGQSQIATLENKNRNFDAYRLLLKNYPINNELIVFLSKIPEPVDLIKLLILVKPKNFCGVKFSQIFTNQLCFQGFKTQEEKHNHDEFISWFKKRYRTENKCFKEIYYLLTNSVVKNLDDSVFKRNVGLLPSLEISNQDNLNRIFLLETSSQIVQKFRSMDKKYKKLCPQINFKQILQDLHNSQKIHERRFQVASKIDDHLLSKHSRSYLSEAKEVMLNSKIQLMLQRLYFTINSQKQRIVIVVQDEKLQKRIKKYFKETQIDYVDYQVTKAKQSNSISNISVNYLCSTDSFTPFDSTYSIKACIINSSKCFKQFTELKKKHIQKTKRQYQNQYLEQDYFQHYDIQIDRNLKVPLITTAESIHYIDSFWNEFNFEKQSFISSVFNFSLSFVTEKKVQNKIFFEEKYKKPRIPQVYYVFEGSYEKMMLEKFLSNKKIVEQVKIQQNLQEKSKLKGFIENLIQSSNQRLQTLKCPIIEYLDIDEEYDKIDEEAKQLKNSSKASHIEEKVFLPKYANPEIKSFKEMVEQTLNEKSIQEILDNSNDVFYEEQIAQKPHQSLAEPLHRLPNSKNQSKSQINRSKFDQNKNDDDQDQIQTQEDSFQKQEDKNRFQQQLKPFDIQVETIRLSTENNELEYLLLTPDNQIVKSEKDLFDELLGSNFQQQYAGLKQFETINPKLQSKRQPQLSDQLNQNQLQRYLIEPNNIKIEQHPQIKDPQSLLLQNFGAMAYNQKYGISQRKSWSKNIHEQIKQKKKAQRDQDLVEISQSEGIVIDLESLPDIPRKVINPLRRKDQSQRISQMKNRNFYEVPKQKKMCSKKLYEEAISKSKQLWEKKLRKEKELLIVGTKQLEFNLTPKEGWKQSLTSEEIEKLKEKGIRLEQ